MSIRSTVPIDEPPDTNRSSGRGRDQLTATTGLAALTLDAMASVAYGPEAIVLVLALAGGAGIGFTVPVPDGGGAYAVARRRLGRRASLVAAARVWRSHAEQEDERRTTWRAVPRHQGLWEEALSDGGADRIAQRLTGLPAVTVCRQVVAES